MAKRPLSEIANDFYSRQNNTPSSDGVNPENLLNQPWSQIMGGGEPEQSEEKGGLVGGITGFLKGAGRSALNVIKGAAQNPITSTPLGITGLSPRIPAPATPEFLEPKNRAEKIGGLIETGAEIIAPLPGGKQKVGESLINSAYRIFETAMKPSTALSAVERANAVKTALREGISLTNGGLRKLESKIDELEKSLDAPIQAAAKAGKKIPIDFFGSFVDEAKKILGNTADPIFSESAIKNIEKRFGLLVKKFPDGIPIDQAQQMKVSTYQLIKNAYGKLKTSTLEYQKQIARGLKEGVVENVPEVGGINSRLKSLYALEKQLDRSVDRIKNADLMRLGTRVIAGVGGMTGTALAVVSQIFGPSVKSLSAIQMNRLGEFLSRQPARNIETLKKVSKFLGPVNFNNMIQGLRDALSDD